MGQCHGCAGSDDACGRVVGTFDEAVLAAGCLVWAERRVDAGRGRARSIVCCVYPTVVPVKHHRCVLLHATSSSGTL